MNFLVKSMIFLSLLVSGSVYAESGIIKVFSKDGEKTYSADDYVVVRKRPFKKVVQHKHKTPKAEPVVAKVEKCDSKPTCNTVTNITNNIVVPTEIGKYGYKNRINLILGNGPNGINIHNTDNSYEAALNYNSIVGAQYERRITEHFNVNALFFNNKTIGFGVGYDF